MGEILHGIIFITESIFKVFSHLTEFFEEKMNYHRDEKGKIVKVKDDILDGVRYAMMMKRHAIQKYEIDHEPEDWFENESGGYW